MTKDISVAGTDAVDEALPTRRDQLGMVSAEWAVGIIAAIAIALSSAALVIAGYAVGYHRARAAADLSALSGAAAFQQGRDPCAQAVLTARHNGARADRCSQVGDAVDFVVTVRVTVVARTRMPYMPRTVAAEAHAGPVHDVP
jgi:secretion/DNA translocation related TadE-like protein